MDLLKCTQFQFLDAWRNRRYIKVCNRGRYRIVGVTRVSKDEYYIELRKESSLSEVYYFRLLFEHSHIPNVLCEFDVAGE